MKINIEVQLEPGEEQRFAEILTLLRDLSSTFRLREAAPQANGPAAHISPAPLAMTVSPAPAPLAIQSPPPPAVTAPSPAYAAPPAPASPPPQDAQTAPDDSPVAAFYNIIMRIDLDITLEEMDTEGGRLAQYGQAIEQEAARRGGIAAPGVADALVDAVMIALEQEVAQENYRSRIAYIQVFNHTSVQLRVAIRSKLVKLVLRAIDCNRMDFFSFAEAFAAMLKVTCVNERGEPVTLVSTENIFSTMSKILKKPENRCAAITTLGKCIELALQPLLEKLKDERSYVELQAALAYVVEPQFEYDLGYVKENLGIA